MGWLSNSISSGSLVQFFFYRKRWKQNVSLFTQYYDGCVYDGWKMKMGKLLLTFRRRFLRTTRTPLTDICMVTLRFFRFCTLHSYCVREREKMLLARQSYKCHEVRRRRGKIRSNFQLTFGCLWRSRLMARHDNNKRHISRAPNWSQTKLQG